MGLSTQQRLGQNLKILRASKDVNQNEMAEYIGLTRSSYAQYELGNRTPDAHTLYAIAKFYKISIDLLFEPDLSKFLSEMTYSQIDGDNSQLLIDNFRRLSPSTRADLLNTLRNFSNGTRLKSKTKKNLRNAAK